MDIHFSPTVHDILRLIVGFREKPVKSPACEYTYIIMGTPGPTGKTWLCNQLRQRGFKAVEISESIHSFVSYARSGNHYIVDHDSETVTIILNNKIDCPHAEIALF